MKIHQDFILLILNCKKYKYKALKQKNSWLKNIPNNLIYFHIIGEETLTNDFKFDNEEQVLYVRTADDYNNLPKKMMMAYYAINNTYDFKYVFKTDDDEKLIYNKFFDKLIGQFLCNTQINYGGFIVNIKNDHYSTHHLLHPELPPNLPIRKTIYCSGRFYFMSINAVKDILNKKKLIENEYFEDYAIGFYMDDIYKENMLYIEHHAYLIEDNDYNGYNI
jgi:hypothetical protein